VGDFTRGKKGSHNGTQSQGECGSDLRKAAGKRTVEEKSGEGVREHAGRRDILQDARYIKNAE